MHSPGCASTEMTGLILLNKQGEPPGDPKHEIGYEHDLVEICADCNGATLERLRHDCFDFEEVWDQYEWYDLSPADGIRLRAIAARCDRPLDPYCRCDVHQSLRASAATLPHSGWSAGFEWASHRHAIALTDAPRPGFRLVATTAPSGGADEPPSTSTRDPSDARPAAPAASPAGIWSVWLMFAAFPVLLAMALTLYFRAVDWPFLVDALVVIVAVPAAFVVATMIGALASALAGRGKG